jgi:hypothetical protein
MTYDLISYYIPTAGHKKIEDITPFQRVTTTFFATQTQCDADMLNQSPDIKTVTNWPKLPTNDLTWLSDGGN